MSSFRSAVDGEGEGAGDDAGIGADGARGTEASTGDGEVEMECMLVWRGEGLGRMDEDVR